MAPPSRAAGCSGAGAGAQHTFLWQHNTMESLLERGEKLDDLVSKSEVLGAQSKAFYKTVGVRVTPSPRELGGVQSHPWGAQLCVLGRDHPCSPRRGVQGAWRPQLQPPAPPWGCPAPCPGPCLSQLLAPALATRKGASGPSAFVLCPPPAGEGMCGTPKPSGSFTNGFPSLPRPESRTPAVKSCDVEPGVSTSGPPALHSPPRAVPGAGPGVLSPLG